MKKLTSFMLIAFLGGCVSTQEVYMADGSQGYHLKCDGPMLTMSDCYQEAGNICGPAGYKVLNQSGEAIPYAQTSVTANKHGTNVNSSSGTVINRDLFIHCKGAPVK